ncbi:MAG: histidine--tRNA ligase [bacterium]
MAAEEFQPLQGMSDISAPEVELWQDIEAQARRIFHLYGYTEVRTPVLERAGLFERSLGDTTDVVQKEMYAFEDRGGRRIALRPEGTASVIRYVASRGQDAADARLYYCGPMFRAERPQAGRKRQFHQVGSEFIGPANPAADAETLALQIHLLSSWGLKGFNVQVNTRGLPEDRKAVQDGLARLLEPRIGELCEDCRRRMATNILRVLDCKNESCRAIAKSLPPVTEFMSEEARKYLADVVAWLERLEIRATVNPALVRGLDYYVHTVWEITHPALGAQDALCGGGRYCIDVAGKVIEGVGFAMGLERVITALSTPGLDAPVSRMPLVWLVSMGEKAFAENVILLQSLRMRSIRSGMDLAGKSVKAQMRAADRAGATIVILRGDMEMEKGTFQFKDMAAGTQVEVEMPELMERLKPAMAVV